MMATVAMAPMSAPIASERFQLGGGPCVPPGGGPTGGGAMRGAAGGCWPVLSGAVFGVAERFSLTVGSEDCACGGVEGWTDEIGEVIVSGMGADGMGGAGGEACGVNPGGLANWPDDMSRPGGLRSAAGPGGGGGGDCGRGGGTRGGTLMVGGSGRAAA